MAKINLIATARRWFVGAFGNLSISPTFVAKLAAVPAGDVIVFGDKVEPNIKIVGVSLFTCALGDGTTLTVKVGSVIIVHAEDTAVPVAKYLPVNDVITVQGQELTLTVEGADTTGTVKLKLHYEVMGNL